jgi:hypothetical protein
LQFHRVLTTIATPRCADLLSRVPRHVGSAQGRRLRAPGIAAPRWEDRLNPRKHLFALLAALSWTLIAFIGYQKVPALYRHLMVITRFKEADAEVISFAAKPGPGPGPAAKESRLFLHYMVGDSRYTSLRFRSLSGELSQEDVSHRFPAGTKFKVRYDPEEPDKAYAEVSLPRTTVLWLAIFVPLVAAAVFLTRAALKQPDRKAA